MTSGPQTMLVVEYPCDRFCRIEVDLTGEQSRVTLQQLREKADVLHQHEHEPQPAEADAPVVDQEPARRPAATVFLAAPGHGKDRRR
ncbi:hypothetical protein [Couchioplanes caeruleus]|uniref:Uncharacterized protein n=2 Tax=Couchioplanes caeruleus TaxID=56438 RepID=A0A1K0FE32_9ACTN|nr:hypothetical protein [Couchioplanes caeruleus]OJF11081.1 hypothetical protein BG844_28470 [Couchioplanes caeruleus subsp. caeruleus]ROP33704.1 hypothetical protein EDD30_6738 [Couchioplanes caeruleus]